LYGSWTASKENIKKIERRQRRRDYTEISESFHFIFILQSSTANRHEEIIIISN